MAVYRDYAPKVFLNGVDISSVVASYSVESRPAYMSTTTLEIVGPVTLDAHGHLHIEVEPIQRATEQAVLAAQRAIRLTEDGE